MKKAYTYQGENDLRVEDSQAVQRYQDLRVYKLAFDSAMEIFRVSKEWPAARSIH